MGLKAADNLRRVCLYTHRLGHHHKIFFAFMRGLFPVHELCALLTALQIANRDILGKQVPLAWVVSVLRSTSQSLGADDLRHHPLRGLLPYWRLHPLPGTRKREDGKQM